MRRRRAVGLLLVVIGCLTALLPALAVATPGGANFAWLLGGWRQPESKGRWHEVTWILTQEGVRGTLDTVSTDGRRSPIAVYLIRPAGKHMTLTLQRFPVSPSLPAELNAGRGSLRHPSNASGSLMVFSGGLVADQALRFERLLPRGASKDDPVFVQISLQDKTLYVEHARTRRWVALWDREPFTRREGDATSRPVDGGQSR